MQIRNIAIIAHVDHGKTTLVDALLRQTKTELNKEAAGSDLIMDSNELERERGITIFSKNASVQYKDCKINIIDTPGHADFGGEVERVLKLADAALLVVDAQEGPMPQTRFVLRKALALKLKIIVVINKIDKPGANIDQAVNQVFDLCVELGADDATLDFPIVYASGKAGLAGRMPDITTMDSITPLLDVVMEQCPEPSGDPEAPLQVLITNITADDFKGRIGTGRIANGRLQAGQDVMLINRAGEMKKYRLTALMTFEGLRLIDVTEAIAGDVVAIAGIAELGIGETLADVEQPVALPVLAIEEPTVKMNFQVNDSPFAGKEGEYSTSRQIRERLYKELETDMALQVEDGTRGDWIVSGRGELHLAILIERLRREGYEFQVARPQVITKLIDGVTHTPYERVTIEVPDESSGSVIQKLSSRRGTMQNLRTHEGITTLEFLMPTRGLFGYHTDFLTDTKGLGIMNSIFEDYQPDPGNWPARDRGSLVCHETGTTTTYGLVGAQDRGNLFVSPGLAVYQGQVVGQNARPEDISVNVCRAKQLTNMRSKGDGVDVYLKVPLLMDLESAIEYISDDELVEITPQNIRIRKKILDPALAKKQARQKS